MEGTFYYRKITLYCSILKIYCIYYTNQNKKNSKTAEFTISGTTLDNELGFNGINEG